MKLGGDHNALFTVQKYTEVYILPSLTTQNSIFPVIKYGGFNMGFWASDLIIKYQTKQSVIAQRLTLAL